MNKISVIIPTFNRKALTIRAIESCMNQTYKNIEIIVIDDCSTDGTFDFLKNSYPSIKIKSTRKRLGPGNARNMGISLADGDYIAFLDSDDTWEREKLKEQIKLSKYFPFICSNAYINQTFNTYFSGIKSKEMNFIEMFISNKIITSSVLVHKSLLSINFPNNMFFGEDLVFWLSILINNNVFYIETPLIDYSMLNTGKLSKKYNHGPLITRMNVLYRLITAYLNNDRKVS